MAIAISCPFVLHWNIPKKFLTFLNKYINFKINKSCTSTSLSSPPSIALFLFYHLFLSLTLPPVCSYRCCCFSSRLSRHYDLQNKPCHVSEGDSVKLVSTSSPPPCYACSSTPLMSGQPYWLRQARLTDKRCWSKKGESEGWDGAENGW